MLDDSIKSSNAIGNIDRSMQEATKVTEASIEDAKPNIDRAGTPEKKKKAGVPVSGLKT